MALRLAHILGWLLGLVVVAVIVFASVLVADEVLRQPRILLVAGRVRKTAERVFESRVAIHPRAFRRRTENRIEMVGALDGRIEKPSVARGAMVRNAHLDKVAHHVKLVVARLLEMRETVQERVAVDIARFLLRSENDRDPLLDLPSQKVLPRLKLRVIARVEFQRKRRCLYDIVGIGVRPLAPFEFRLLCVL